MSGGKKEEFSSFQIGSMPGFGPGGGTLPPSTPTPVATPTPTSAEQLEAPAERHFPTLEELIESDDQTIQTFAEEMGQTCQELDALIEKRTGRIKQEAQRARQAYEHVFSLIDYLLEVKASLLNPEGAEGQG